MLLKRLSKQPDISCFQYIYDTWILQQQTNNQQTKIISLHGWHVQAMPLFYIGKKWYLH
jgi:hypothetical protein